MSQTENICQGQTFLTLTTNHLALKLHRLLAKGKENVFFSPFSISTAMAMLVFAAEGQTESELRAALGYGHASDKLQKSVLKRDEIAMTFQKHKSILSKNEESYTLLWANSMLSQKELKVKEDYKQILVDSFETLLLEVDFHENEKTIGEINEWVKEKTNGMITELTQSLDPSTGLVLLNAVYFKGTWHDPFWKSRTRPREFYNKGMEDNVKEVNMMFMVEIVPFYEDTSMQVLQLPYVAEKVAMLIFLPRAKNGLKNVEDGFTPSFLQDFRDKLRETEVKVTLPKFRLEYTKSLVPCFKELDVIRVFERGAELGIASDSPELSVSEILHKAVLVVDEEGSRGTSATMVEVESCDTIKPEPEFIADHPFAFVIYNTRSQLILFMGRVEEL